MLYLCTIFVPEKDVSGEKLDYYAQKSEWIGYKSKEEATKEYMKRHPELNKLYAIDDVKILAESARLINNYQDGENGYLIAIEAMIEYLKANTDKNA